MDRGFACRRYEPDLDDLLSDEMMAPVLRSAGLDAEEFRKLMARTARRFDQRDAFGEGGRGR